MSEDVRITMPPHPFLYEGREAMLPLLDRAFAEPSMGDWKLEPTIANRMPTAASYPRSPGDAVYRAFKFDGLRIADGAIAEITTFDAHLFLAFGLPLTRGPLTFRAKGSRPHGGTQWRRRTPIGLTLALASFEC